MKPSTIQSLALLLFGTHLVIANDSIPAREVAKQRYEAMQRHLHQHGGIGHDHKRELSISMTSTMEGDSTTSVASTSNVESSGDQPSQTSSQLSSTSTSLVPAATPSETSSTSVISDTTSPTATPTAFSNIPSRILAGTIVTTTTTPTCATPYTAGGFTISGTGTLPRPTAFVKKAIRSQQLTINNQPFKIVGPNIYWLCQDENYGPVGSYTDKGRIREALAAAVAMGANTIRAHSCGISVGPNNPYQLEPAWNKFNDAAWDVRDYAIFAAREYGLRMVIPLVDNYRYYHGSKYDFIKFRFGDTSNPGTAFFNNRAVVAAYGGYITKVLARVNPYTGLRYADDPTILAWETGNELGGYINAEPWPSTYWTTNIIQYIRSVDSNHLIIDGSNGIYNYTTKATPEGLRNRGVNMVSDHLYPRNSPLVNAEYPIASNAFKNFLIGEWDWTNSFGGTPIDDFITTLESNAFVGDMIWSYFGRDPQCCAYVKHNDGYSLYYPDGPNTVAEKSNILKVVQHWYRVTNRPIPSTLPDVLCPQPEF